MTLLGDLVQYEFLRNALAAGLIVSVVCAILGVFLVLRGMSLLGDGLAHISFAGVAIGLVAGLLPLATAFAAAVLGAITIHYLRERRVVKGDTAIGILFTAGLAGGILLVSGGRGLGNVQSYLFGTLIAIPKADIVAIAVVGILLLVLLALFYREFVYMTFSEEAARVSGLPVHLLNLLFVSLTAATIVLAARLTGVLLVSALLVVPAATALQLGRGFRGTLAWSVLFGLSSVVAGLAFSVERGTAPGATIAAFNVALFALVSVGRRILTRATRGRAAG